MSNPQMIPMVAADGTVGEIPSERVTEALNSGKFRLGVKLQAPSGEVGIIPRDNIVKALQTPGMHVLADSAKYAISDKGLYGTDDKSVQPWSLKNDPVINDIGQMVKGTAQNAYQISTPGIAASIATDKKPELRAKIPNALQPTPLKNVPEQVAINALPMMVGADELPRTSQAPKPSAAPSPAAAITRQAAETIAQKMIREIPGVGGLMRFTDLAKMVFEKAKSMPEAPPAPEVPPWWGKENVGPPEMWGREIPQPAAQSAPRVASPATAKVSRADLGKLIESEVRKSLGAPPPAEIKPGVPIKNQPVVPEGHTPIESSTGLTSFKYDPETKELTLHGQNGRGYIYGDVSPDQAQSFAEADSKGKAWNVIRQSNSPLTAKIINGKRVAAKPSVSDSLESILEQSIREARKGK